MRTKSTLLILAMGIGGFLVMGLLTKFVLDSNPALLRLAKMKQALAEDFSPRGAETVGLRSLPAGRGFEIRVETARSRQVDPGSFAKEVAECFLRKYSGPAPVSLVLILMEPRGMGCGGGEKWFEKEISVLDLRTEMELRAALGRLAAAVAGREGFRMRPAEPVEPIRIAVEVPPPRDASDLDLAAGFLRDKAREHLAAGSARAVTIEIRSSAAGQPVLREEKLEPPRSGRRPVPVPVSGSGSGAGASAGAGPDSGPALPPGVAPAAGGGRR